MPTGKQIRNSLFGLTYGMSAESLYSKFEELNRQATHSLDGKGDMVMQINEIIAELDKLNKIKDNPELAKQLLQCLRYVTLHLKQQAAKQEKLEKYDKRLEAVEKAVEQNGADISELHDGVHSLQNNMEG